MQSLLWETCEEHHDLFGRRAPQNFQSRLPLPHNLSYITLNYALVFSFSQFHIFHHLPFMPQSFIAYMQNSANLRLTCRYWALGPRCPDGVLCNFAHSDTGQLATPTYQPGTCLVFGQHGYCYKGTNCGYEHRCTGVTGLHQGSEL